MCSSSPDCYYSVPLGLVSFSEVDFHCTVHYNLNGEVLVTCAQRGWGVAPLLVSRSNTGTGLVLIVFVLLQHRLLVVPHVLHVLRCSRAVVHRDMDAATTSRRTPPPGNAVPHRRRDDPPQSPDRLPVAVVAQRRIMKAGADGSPVRRSPRLSCLPPPQPPMESQATQDLGESSDDDSWSVDDVALHLSRDETPENDAVPPDGE